MIVTLLQKKPHQVIHTTMHSERDDTRMKSKVCRIGGHNEEEYGHKYN